MKAQALVFHMQYNDALTIGGYSRTAETGTASEKFEETAIGATYTIATGLSASITSTNSDIDTTTIAALFLV